MTFRWISLTVAFFGLLLVSTACGPECPEGQKKCGETCVNTQVDRSHCGECNKACEAGQLCSAGTCALTCQAGLTECEGLCSDTKTDRNNCGGCGKQCKSGELCTEGACKLSCPEKQTDCSGACVDTQTNTQNCGTCGKQCEIGQVCNAGKCELVCSNGLTSCSDACVNTKTDRNHCGSCGKACATGQVCNAGTCALTCQKDDSSCGGNCTNTQTDFNHCGKCDNSCKSGEICKAGTCVLNCQDGYTNCTGSCINTKVSRLHCGACDKACANGEICNAGTCEVSCPTGLSVCNNTCVNLNTDAKNCGKCGTACTGNDVCQSGTCTVYCQKGYSECSKNCVDLQQDEKNCGKCGTSCPTGEVCAQGKCTKPCPNGTRPCNSACINYSNDPQNCGRCGNVCKANQACLGGYCEPCTDCPVWVKKYGAFNAEAIFGMTVDSNDNIYITGGFTKVSRFGKTILTSAGSDDIFVAKLSPNGDVLWVKQAGGTGTDDGYAIGVDSSGNVYITGTFTGTATFGPTQLSSAGGYDIFWAKLDKDGKWLKAISNGGTSADYGLSLAIDSSGNSYITGQVTIPNVTKGGADIYIAKLDNQGKILWFRTAGSSSSEEGKGIAVDSKGNIYVTGRFYSSVVFGSTTLTSKGSSDVFVVKYDNAGKVLWATSAGGTSIEYGNAITVDSAGNVFVTGRFSKATADAEFGTHKLKSNGGYDIFVAKVDSTGKWAWAVSAGGSGSDNSNGIGVDSKGIVYAAGYFSGGSATFDKATLTAPGSGEEMFILQVDGTGKVMGATRMGGTGNDRVYAMAMSSKDAIYVTGIFSVEATFGKLSLLTSGNIDSFVAKYTKPGEAFCPSTGYNVCNKACIDTTVDNKNCGVCGKQCATGEICGAGKCLKAPVGIVLQELNIDAPDYVGLKNTSNKDINLAGLNLVLYYTSDSISTPSVNFQLPSFTLKAGATVLCVEFSTTAGEINCPSIPYISSSDFVALLCFGKCTASNGSNVLDAAVVGAPSSVKLPQGITFSGSIPNMTSTQSGTSSYIRSTTASKHPIFNGTEWKIGPKTR